MPLRQSQQNNLDSKTLDFAQVMEREVYELVHHSPGGAHTLSIRLGYPSMEALANEVCLTNERAKFGAVDFFIALLKTGNYRSLDVLDSMLGRKQVKQARFDNLFKALAALGSEQSDVNSVVLEALADGELSPREKVEINKEIAEARAALDQLQQMVNCHGGA